MLLVCENIDLLLKEKKIPKMQFYKDCNISSAAYSLWKTGKTKPAIKSLEVIADYLNVSVSELMGENKNIPIPKTENEDISPARRQLLDSVDGMNEEQIIKLMGIINEAKKLL